MDMKKLENTIFIIAMIFIVSLSVLVSIGVILKFLIWALS